jgi:lysylphosphatidylglycerol synthetase-like protein (DUF2156 family)
MTAPALRLPCWLSLCCCSWNRVVIIGTGEPLAPRSAWRQLTEAFLQEFPKAYFYHITEEFADLLHDMGYWINGCGTETTLQVCSPASAQHP